MPETCNQLKIPVKGRVIANMAQDADGRKFNRIPGYTRKQNGKTVQVRPHIRSNRSDSKGIKK